MNQNSMTILTGDGPVTIFTDLDTLTEEEKEVLCDDSEKF